MKIKIDVFSLKHYLLMLLMLHFHGAVITQNHQNIFILCSLLISITFIFKTRILKRKLDKFLLFLIVLSFSLFLTVILTEGSLSIFSVLNILNRFLLIYTIYLYDKENFLKRLVKLSVCLSFISLIFFSISLVHLETIRTISLEIPQIGSSRIYLWNPVFSVLSRDYDRNIGIYGEPGLHQIVPNTILFLLLFYNNKDLGIEIEQRKKYIIIILVTIATIQSITGYFATVAILIGYFIQLKSVEKRGLQKLFLIIAFAFILVATYQGPEGIITSQFLNTVISSEGDFDLNASSGRSRTVAMSADLRIAGDFPLGVGFEKMGVIWRSYLTDEIPDISSPVGLTRSLATIGIPSTLLISWFYIWNGWKNKKDYISYGVYLFVLINTSLAQPVFWFPMLMILPLIENKNLPIETTLKRGDVL